MNSKVILESNEKYINSIITIPNILSLFRFLLIPVFVYFYISKQAYTETALILILSGLTDIVDGFIARHYHMISNVGKVLDPVADKATQFAMLMCLISKFPWIKILLFVLIIKELALGLSGYLVIRKQKIVMGANWHGKVATCLLYLLMISHVFYSNIPEMISKVSVLICLIMMLISLVLYVVRNYRIWKEVRFQWKK